VADLTLQVFEDDEERPRDSVIIHSPPKGKLAASGDGPDRLLCGGCGEVLADGVTPGDVVGTLIQCPECGKLNEPDA
jgi:ribosomal protein S27AE